MHLIKELKQKIYAGNDISKEEALALADTSTDLQELAAAADEIRKHLCGNRFDLCTIVNGKCGRCPEDCKYCAQSAHYQTDCHDSYPILSTQALLEGAARSKEQGVLRYSIVTSGRQLDSREVEEVCVSIREIRRQVGIEICVSFGLLDEMQFRRLKEAGASRVHCNLETSRRFFSQVCTTHTYEDKIAVLRAARAAGLSVCSGGIVGLGEEMEDRIDLALTLRELGVKSVPVNLLNPIKGTPYENNPILTSEAFCRTISIFRFLIPDADIRLAGGRGLLGDKGERCFVSGANAAISGDMLTTAGITTAADLALLRRLGYVVKK
ncbi:MAG: biotin synthase BioB [Lachnospiraceae bacterium]|nr:biotin synthase BioB [Lachnospiraceae bacterium]